MKRVGTCSSALLAAGLLFAAGAAALTTESRAGRSGAPR
jgi:hypothetical protein